MIENLVFSGGGTKCISFLGVLKYLEESGLEKNIKNIIGTSGGAIFSLVFILEYSYIDLENLVINLDMEILKDMSGENLIEFFQNFGLDTGNKIEHLIKLLISKKGFSEEITFLELHNRTKKNLIITGTCLNKQQTEYFNYINTPNMMVYKAIRISMSIPIIYNKVDYKSHIYVDGGISNNYPIDYFDQEISKTIGFLILSDNNNDIIDIKGIDTFMYYNLLILSSSIDSSKFLLYKKQTVRLKCSYTNLKFNLSKEEKMETINNSYDDTKEYFKNMIIKNIGKSKKKSINFQELLSNIQVKNVQINLEDLFNN
jgi:NTE family protein